MADIKEQKKQARKLFREMRNAIDQEYRDIADRVLFDKVISSDVYRNAKVILAYYPVKNEPDILSIVKHALKENKRVAFPISHPEGFVLSFKFILSLDELVDGEYSIPEPPVSAEEYVCNSTTLCIVPGLAFDRDGKRIGYGKGYYDRFLESFSGTSMGLCYSDFLVDSLPVEKTDVSIDIVVSDKEEIYINGK